MIDGTEWEVINTEMAEYDQMRETIIKRSREIQKASKQAIFSLHRGDDTKAETLINEAMSVAKELYPTVPILSQSLEEPPVLLSPSPPFPFSSSPPPLLSFFQIPPLVPSQIEANPTLRPGSYSNSLEEWAEAVTFRTYLLEKRLARKGEMPLVTSEEYLGGVLDFTGELNRYAVQKATARDVEEVRRCKVSREGRGGGGDV